MSKCKLAALAALICLTLAHSVPSHAQNDGGASGNGGNALKSTPADVARALEWLEVYNAIVYFDNMMAPHNPVPLQDPRARAILQKIVHQYLSPPGSAGPWFTSPTISELYAPQAAPCKAGALDRDGAFLIVNGQPKICLSTDLLSRFSYSALLRSELMPLVFHELAHSVGYGEDDAQFIEAYVDQHYASGQTQGACSMTFNGFMGRQNDPDKSFVVELAFGQAREAAVSVIAPNTYDTWRSETGEATKTYRSSEKYSAKPWNGAFKGEWNSTNGGWISFPLKNPDGSISKQRIDFGPLDSAGRATISTKFIVWNGQRRRLLEQVWDGKDDIVPSTIQFEGCQE